MADDQESEMNDGYVSALRTVGAVRVTFEDGSPPALVEILATETAEVLELIDTSDYGRFQYVLLLPWSLGEEINFHVGNAGAGFAPAVAAMIRDKREDD